MSSLIEQAAKRLEQLRRAGASLPVSNGPSVNVEAPTRPVEPPKEAGQAPAAPLAQVS